MQSNENISHGPLTSPREMKILVFLWVMGFNATFNNISVTSWRLFFYEIFHKDIFVPIVTEFSTHQEGSHLQEVYNQGRSHQMPFYISHNSHH
jgi:hypothetical protein